MGESLLSMIREFVSRQSSGSLRVGTTGRWVSLHSTLAQSNLIAGVLLDLVVLVDVEESIGY